MKRIATCQACNFIIAGVKSRKAIQHTCGKTQQEIVEFTIRQNHNKALSDVRGITNLTTNKEKDNA